VVDAHDSVTALAEVDDEVSPDEPFGTRDQCLHDEPAAMS
jgi:hypothetical protein